MTRYDIGNLSDFQPGEIRRVEVGGHALCVAHVATGGIFAVADRCSHEDAELSDGDLIGSELECPVHGSRFDVKTGEVRCLPATTPIAVYTVEIDPRDATIYVEL